MNTPSDKNIRKFDARPGRLIVVDGVRWKYKVGRGSVLAYSETGERRCEDCWKIKGQSDPNIFGRGQWKKTVDGMIFPSDIERWLQ